MAVPGHPENTVACRLPNLLIWKKWSGRRLEGYQMEFVEAPKNSKDPEGESEDSQIEKRPDIITEIINRINAGTLDPLDLLLIDDIFSS